MFFFYNFILTSNFLSPNKMMRSHKKMCLIITENEILTGFLPDPLTGRCDHPGGLIMGHGTLDIAQWKYGYKSPNDSQTLLIFKKPESYKLTKFLFA